MSLTSGFSVGNYADLYYGGYNPASPSQPLIITGTEAIKNTIKMYLMSQKGDYGRNVTRGGPLFEVIGKQVSNPTKQAIYDSINAAVSSYSNIIVTSVDVVPITRGWKISVTFTDTGNKFVDTLNLAINQLENT